MYYSGSPDMLVHNYQTAWLYVSDDSPFHSLCCKNPKCLVIKLSFFCHLVRSYTRSHRDKVSNLRNVETMGSLKLVI